MSKENSIYLQILSSNIMHNISNKYIPGGEPNDSLLIKSGEEIQKFFENGETKDGILVVVFDIELVIVEEYSKLFHIQFVKKNLE